MRKLKFFFCAVLIASVLRGLAESIVATTWGTIQSCTPSSGAGNECQIPASTVSYIHKKSGSTITQKSSIDAWGLNLNAGEKVKIELTVGDYKDSAILTGWIARTSSYSGPDGRQSVTLSDLKNDYSSGDRSGITEFYVKCTGVSGSYKSYDVILAANGSTICSLSAYEGDIWMYVACTQGTAGNNDHKYVAYTGRVIRVAPPSGSVANIVATYDAASSAIRLSWDAHYLASYYQLKCSRNGGSYLLLEDEWESTIYLHDDLTAGCTYQYAICPYNDEGNGSWSYSKKINVPATPDPTESYSISYSNCDSLGSGYPESAEIDSDFCVSIPAKSGYRFLGWKVTSGLNAATAMWGMGGCNMTKVGTSDTLCAVDGDSIYFRNLALAGGAVVLTAVWEKAQTYKIKYVLNGGLAGSRAPTECIYGTAYVISSPVRTGYLFAGWKIEGLSDTARIGGSDSPDQDLCTILFFKPHVAGTQYDTCYYLNLCDTDGGTVTMTATWREVPKTYHVSYSNYGVHGLHHQSVATSGIPFVVSSPVKKGYAFIGWTVTSGLNATTAMWGTSDSPSSPIPDAETRCGSWAEDTYFLDLTMTDGGSVTLSGNWMEITAPSAPNISVTTYGNLTANDSYVNLEWEAVAGAVRYAIYRSSSETGEKTLLCSSCKDTSYKDYAADSSLIPGKKYWYWVKAFDAYGCSSTFSNSDWGNIWVTMELSVGDCIVGSSGGKTNIYFSSNSSWTAEVTEGSEWLSISPSSGSGEKTCIQLSADCNSSSSLLYGVVTITAGGDVDYTCQYNFKVTQWNAGRDFSYSVEDGKATITNYHGFGGVVTVPSRIDGYPVTAIGEGSFLRCATLTSVSIPEGVTNIGSQAFYVCQNLSSVKIPSSLTCLGTEVFFCCDKLTDIVIDKGNECFAMRNGLLCTWDGSTVLYCLSGYSGSMEFSENVTKIGDYAFCGCNVTSVSIPSGVTTIGYCAFGFSDLVSLTIHPGVRDIGGLAFYNCNHLKSVAIPSGVTSVGRSAFACCAELTSVTIPSSVVSIGDKAFNGSRKLCEVWTDLGDELRIRDLLTDSGFDCTALEIHSKFHRVTYQPGSNGSGESQSAVKTNGVNLILAVPIFTRYGYSQSGWAREDGAVANDFALEGIYDQDNPIDLYPVWTANVSRIVFHFQGGADGTAVTSAVFDAELPVIAVPHREGYSFGGFFVDPDCIGKQYYDESGHGVARWDVDGPTTLYAKWKLSVDSTGDLALYKPSGWPHSVFATSNNTYSALHSFLPTDTFKVWYAVVNRGERAVVDIPVRIALYEGAREVRSVTITNTVSVGLAKNQGFQKTAIWKVLRRLPYGTYRLTVTIDPEGSAVEDSDLSNNSSSFYFTLVNDALSIRDEVGLSAQDLSKSGLVTVQTNCVSSGSYALQFGPCDVTVTNLLKATFLGPGELTYKLSGNPLANVVRMVSLDGVVRSRVSGTSSMWFSGSLKIPAGLHEICWSFAPYVATGNGQYIGFLDAVVWTPTEVAVSPDITGGSEITVTSDWVSRDLESRFGRGKAKDFSDRFGTDFTAALLKQTGKTDARGNALYVWQDYVAGTDPLDETSRFETQIEMKDGKPIVTWQPALNGKGVQMGVRTYTTYGSNDLRSWSKVPSGAEGDYRYFSVTVEMP